MFSIKTSGCCDDCGCLLLTMTTMDMNGRMMTTDCTILPKLHVCHGYIRKASKKQSKLKASAMKATHVLFIVVISISYTLIGFAESPGSVSFRINDHHQSPSTQRHPVERTNFLKLVEAPKGPRWRRRLSEQVNRWNLWNQKRYRNIYDWWLFPNMSSLFFLFAIN